MAVEEKNIEKISWNCKPRGILFINEGDLIMKITKTRLKQIIKEELRKTLKEATYAGHPGPGPARPKKIDFPDFYGEPTTEKELKGALTAFFDEIKLPGNPSDRSAVRDVLVRGFLEPDGLDYLLNTSLWGDFPDSPGRIAYVLGMGERTSYENLQNLAPDGGWLAYKPWTDRFSTLVGDSWEGDGYRNADATVSRIKQLILKQQPDARAASPSNIS